MTIHALVAAPPRPGHTGLEGGPLDDAAAAALAAAMLRDAVAGVSASGGELLVNFPSSDQLPRGARTTASPENDLRDLVASVLGDLDAVRFEPQVGATPAERIGNTLEHLLEQEGEASAAVIDGRAPTLDRAVFDESAMKLRSRDAVIGPAPAGRVAYLGLSEPLELAGLEVPFELEAVVNRAREAGLDVDFLGLHPRIDTPIDLETLRPLLAARRAAGRRVPEHTADQLASLAP